MKSKFNYKKFRKSQILDSIRVLDVSCDVLLDILLDKILEQQDYILELRQSYAKLSCLYDMMLDDKFRKKSVF